MNNILVFAHFDKHDLIEDYVIFYLKSLKKIAQTIIFVSDSNLLDIEVNKLQGIVDYTLVEHHGEYDFGSYKRGYKLAEEKNLLNSAENLFFVNDSCFAILGSIEDFYAEMSQKGTDFWGYTENFNEFNGAQSEEYSTNKKHIQSYFICFKNNVFNSDIFKSFINSIKKEKDKKNIITNYEMGLTNKLSYAGFTYSSKYSTDLFRLNQLEILSKKDIKPHLFIKKSLVYRLYFKFTLSKHKKRIEKYTKYPISLIYKSLLINRNLKKLSFSRLFKVLVSYIKFC